MRARCVFQATPEIGKVSTSSCREKQCRCFLITPAPHSDIDHRDWHPRKSPLSKQNRLGKWRGSRINWAAQGRRRRECVGIKSQNQNVVWKIAPALQVISSANQQAILLCVCLLGDFWGDLANASKVCNTVVVWSPLLSPWKDPSKYLGKCEWVGTCYYCLYGFGKTFLYYSGYVFSIILDIYYIYIYIYIYMLI